MTQQLNQPIPLFILNRNADKATLQEGLREYLGKLESITHLGVTNEITDYSRSILHYYLWTLSSFAENIKELVNAIAMMDETKK